MVHGLSQLPVLLLTRFSSGSLHYQETPRKAYKRKGGIRVWRRFQICLFKVLQPAERTSRVMGLSHCLTWRIDYFDILLLPFFFLSWGLGSLLFFRLTPGFVLCWSFWAVSCLVPLSLYIECKHGPFSFCIFFPYPLITSKGESWQLVVWVAILTMKVSDQSQSTMNNIYNIF